MPHHLIFEGAELSGKSWLMSQVYDHLEAKYNKNRVQLDGCHWFNCDVGVYGSKSGKKIIKHYLEILNTLRNKNLLVEKFHLADLVYSRMHRGVEVEYADIEEKLKKLGFKIILVSFPEDEKLLAGRIKDRLNLYPHYERILRNSAWYLQQQKEYLREIKKSRLPYLIVKTEKLPDNKLTDKILKWINEK